MVKDKSLLEDWDFVKELDNQVAEAISGGTAPDLAIVGGWWEPRSWIVSPGTTVSFNFKVKNLGNAPVPANSFVKVNGVGSYSGGFSGGLQPGEEKIANVEYPLYGSGQTYRMVFSVDPENTILESNEQNNQTREIVIRTHW